MFCFVCFLNKTWHQPLSKPINQTLSTSSNISICLFFSEFEEQLSQKSQLSKRLNANLYVDCDSWFLTLTEMRCWILPQHFSQGLCLAEAQALSGNMIYNLSLLMSRRSIRVCCVCAYVFLCMCLCGWVWACTCVQGFLYDVAQNKVWKRGYILSQQSQCALRRK